MKLAVSNPDKPVRPALPIMTIKEFCEKYPQDFSATANAARIHTEEQLRERYAEFKAEHLEKAHDGIPSLIGFIKVMLPLPEIPVENTSGFPEMSFEITRGAYLVE